MSIILLTNNDLKYPVLHSQLLQFYKNRTEKRILYCKNKDLNTLDGYEVVNFEITSMAVINYIWYILNIRRIIITSSNEDIFHIRGFVAGFIFFISNILSFRKINFIYDPRGAFITEKIETNSKLKYLSFLLKRIELYLISKSRSTIVTSQKFKELYSETYGFNEKYSVIYNCSTFKKIERKFSLSLLKEINIIYMGTINYWHDIDEIIKVLKQLKEVLNEKLLNLTFLTSQKNHLLATKKLSNLGYQSVCIKSVPYSEVESIVQQMHIGISVVRPTNSGTIASPIKISDYILSGLIIISNRGIGDFDEYYEKNNSAILYEYGNPNFSLPQIYSISTNPNELLASMITCKSINI